MSFNPALFRGLNGIGPIRPKVKNTFGADEKDGESSNGAACVTSAPTAPTAPTKIDAPVKNQASDIGKEADKPEIIDKLKSPTGGAGSRADILTTYRTAYFAHPDTCPVCRTGMTNAINCREHNELWQAYDAFRQVFNAGQDRAAPAPSARDQTPAPTNGYKVVPTAAIRSQAWHRARDAYVAHRMTCDNCKPSTVCDEGRQLKQVYDVLSLEGGNAGKS